MTACLRRCAVKLQQQWRTRPPRWTPPSQTSPPTSQTPTGAWMRLRRRQRGCQLPWTSSTSASSSAQLVRLGGRAHAEGVGKRSVQQTAANWCLVTRTHTHTHTHTHMQGSTCRRAAHHRRPTSAPHALLGSSPPPRVSRRRARPAPLPRVLPERTSRSAIAPWAKTRVRRVHPGSTRTPAATQRRRARRARARLAGSPPAPPAQRTLGPSVARTALKWCVCVCVCVFVCACVRVCVRVCVCVRACGFFTPGCSILMTLTPHPSRVPQLGYSGCGANSWKMTGAEGGEGMHPQMHGKERVCVCVCVRV